MSRSASTVKEKTKNKKNGQNKSIPIGKEVKKYNCIINLAAVVVAALFSLARSREAGKYLIPQENKNKTKNDFTRGE